MKATKLVALSLALIALLFVACASASALVLVASKNLSQLSVSVPSGAPATRSAAPPAAASAAPSGPQETAIAQVIERANAAQARALAGRDPSPMKGTATDAYYQEMVQTNQDLIDNGVTAIQLVKLEWGPITVSGNSATATTFETWGTTYADGTTDQGRDRNLYTLTLSGGAWKIQSDNHPDA